MMAKYTNFRVTADSIAIIMLLYSAIYLVLGDVFNKREIENKTNSPIKSGPRDK